MGITSVNMNHTTIDNMTEQHDNMWKERLIIGFMIGGPIYLGIIVIMLVYIKRRNQGRRHPAEHEGHQNSGGMRTLES